MRCSNAPHDSTPACAPGSGWTQTAHWQLRVLQSRQSLLMRTCQHCTVCHSEPKTSSMRRACQPRPGSGRTPTASPPRIRSQSRASDERVPCSSARWKRRSSHSPTRRQRATHMAMTARRVGQAAGRRRAWHPASFHWRWAVRRPDRCYDLLRSTAWSGSNQPTDASASVVFCRSHGASTT
jgi:hypothetical protein